MKTKQKNNRGVALLIVVTITTLLVAVTLEVNRKVRTAVVLTATTRDRLKLYQMAVSGIHAGMAMLVRDRTDNEYDSLQEDWANAEKIQEVLQSMPFDEGNVTFKIADELSKIQVNALVQFPDGKQFNESQKIMWDRFSRMLKTQADEEFQNIEATEIINSVKDWIDYGDDDAITGLNGAETDYYEGLDPSYPCKNSPITDINELLKVKGIIPEFFSGMEGMPGLVDFMTVFGMTKAETPVDKRNFKFDGKININTADLPVLIAMVPSENPEYAQDIYDYRMEMSDGQYIHDLSSPTWYKNAPGGDEINIDQNLLTISSDFFQIESTATLREMKLTVKAVVYREKEKETAKWQCRILDWRTL